MRDHYITRPHTNAPSRAARRALLTDRQARRRRSTRLVADAVVAGYLHDISQRHRRPNEGSASLETRGA